MTPAIDSSALLDDENIRIENMNQLEESRKSTLENPINKKARTEPSKNYSHCRSKFIQFVVRQIFSQPFLHFTEPDYIPEPEFTQSDHIPITTHTNAFGVDPVPISWAHPNPDVRGPVICTVRHSSQRNAIGAHQGSYCVYTGLAVAAGR